MNVAIVGGGASGLMAAYCAAKRGHCVTIFEKNEKLGKKIYITGKGRCNLTNLCSPDEFLQSVVRGEKFLRSAIYRFPPQKLCDLFESAGLKLKTERGRRVFPVSDHASDVTKTLEKMCRETGVEVKLNTEIEKIDVLHSTMSGIIAHGERIPCEAAVLATGGLSYPSTGSTGAGLKFAKELGHTVVPCVPSLVGMELLDKFPSLQGLTLKNVVLSARRNDKVLFSQMGEVLFTHFGISGPLVLSLSALINRIPIKELSLSIDFKPALDFKTLDERLLRDIGEHPLQNMQNILRGLLPSTLCQYVAEEAEIYFGMRGCDITKEQRRGLVNVLKNFPLRPRSLRGFEEAVITSGGVALDEVDPKTMQSKLIKGLYFAGEVLDVDALTGGYNLQIAFATGFAAGESI